VAPDEAAAWGLSLIGSGTRACRARDTRVTSYGNHPIMTKNSNLPVAWIDETGRRPGNIAERALALRWATAGTLGG
jgi:hypothetical protein